MPVSVRFPNAVALVDNQGAVLRVFKSPNAARRALGHQLCHLNGWLQGHEVTRHPMGLVEVASGFPVDVGYLRMQNVGYAPPRPSFRQGAVPNISSDSFAQYRAGHVHGKNNRYLLHLRDRCEQWGEPAHRPAKEGLSTRYDGPNFRHAERSWKRHRATQWKAQGS